MTTFKSIKKEELENIPFVKNVTIVDHEAKFLEIVDTDGTSYVIGATYGGVTVSKEAKDEFEDRFKVDALVNGEVSLKTFKTKEEAEAHVRDLHEKEASFLDDAVTAVISEVKYNITKQKYEL
jgi:hypothetical protein